MLKVENLYKAFGGVVAMNDVSLDFPAGSLTAIIGPNGAGKTTFFNLISGHIRPDRGRVLFDGQDLVGLPSLEIVRRGIGRAFQVASIFPSLTLRESLMAAVISHRRQSAQVFTRFPLQSAEDRVAEIMALLELTPKANIESRNLSHGDQKLLDIALALAMDPKVLLLDEPTAGMGSEERWQMIDKVYRLWEAEKMTLIFIEHDMGIVFKIAQTIRVLKYGAVLAEGSPEEIRRNPDVIDAYLGTDHEAAAAVGEG